MISGKITSKKNGNNPLLSAENDNVSQKGDNEFLFEKHLWHCVICDILIYKVFCDTGDSYERYNQNSGRKRE